MRSGQPRRDDWSIGNRINGIVPGTEAWLFLQGGTDATLRGIVGHAAVTSAPWRGRDPKDSSKTTNRIKIKFDWLVPKTDLIDVVTLEAAAPNTRWRSIYNSGARMDPADQLAVRRLWFDASKDSTSDDDEVVPGTFPEGSMRTVQVNKYERSRAARAACVEAHGSTCAVCGLDFKLIYGPIGDGYIQVHHIVPLSQLGAGYEVDPVTDLVPLCANCHVMAHQRKPEPYSVRELKRRVRPPRW